MNRIVFFSYLGLIVALTVISYVLISADPQSGMAGRALVPLLANAFLWYWLPFVISLCRETRNMMGVGLVNLLTGWTGIGWFVALFMALLGRKA